MAGRLQVRLLALTHASSRHQPPNTSWDTVSPLEQVVMEARARQQELWPPGQAVLAEDLLEIRVSRLGVSKGLERFRLPDWEVEQRYAEAMERHEDNRPTRRKQKKVRATAKGSASAEGRDAGGDVESNVAQDISRSRVVEAEENSNGRR